MFNNDKFVQKIGKGVAVINKRYDSTYL